jgi:hypothetical protein
MKCPHCLVTFSAFWQESSIGEDAEYHAYLRKASCPECHRLLLVLKRQRWSPVTGGGAVVTDEQETIVWPRVASREPLPREVPPSFASDYQEASLVLADSPKASAALSRRCLQLLLRDPKAAGVTPGDLAGEIQQVLDARSLPPHLANAVDAIRAIGNFAAHPLKSMSTGEILDVEPGEAEWLLDTLESLFDFYFVQPILLQRKRDALNKKLSDAGKPPLKLGL